MIPQLSNKDLIADLLVNDSMFGSDSPRPIALQRMFQWFGFTNTAIGIAHDLFEQQVDALQCIRVSFLPVEILLPRLVREYEAHFSNFNFFRIPLPRSSDSIDFNNRFAFAGERSKYAVSWSD